MLFSGFVFFLTALSCGNCDCDLIISSVFQADHQTVSQYIDNNVCCLKSRVGTNKSSLLHLAVLPFSDEEILEKRCKLISLLVDKGISIFIEDKQGKTPYEVLEGHHNFPYKQALLQKLGEIQLEEMLGGEISHLYMQNKKEHEKNILALIEQKYPRLKRLFMEKMFE